MADTTPHRARAELGPVVVDGELRWLGATIITQADHSQTGGCMRKWHGMHVEGWREEGSGSQALGQAVHSVVEGYLASGVWPNAEPKPQRIAIAGSRFLKPHVGEALEIERSLLTAEQVASIAAGKPTQTVLMASGVPISGHVDLYRPSAKFVNPMGELVREPFPYTDEVLDHKTTKDFKWAKNGASLLDTVQMVLYAEWRARFRPHLQNLRVSHVYYKTTGTPDAMKSTTCVSRDEIGKRWERIDRLAGTLVQIARVKPGHMNDVPANTDACRVFNRICHIADRCNANYQTTFHTFAGGTEMSDSLLDMFEEDPAPAVIDLNAEIAKLAAEETAAKAVTPATPTPPPAPAVDPAFAEAVKSLESSSWGFPPLGGDAAVAKATLMGMTLSTGAGLAGTGKLAKLPPINDLAVLVKLAADVAKKDAAASVVPSATAATAGLLPPDAPASDPVLAAKPLATPPAAPAPVAETATPAQVAPVAEAPKKRGRPAKSSGATGQAENPDNGTGFALYVDCYPLTGGFEYLDAYIEEGCAEIAKVHGLSEIRLGDSNSELGFGRWRGVLTAAAKMNPPQGTFVVITDTEIKREVAAALAPLARGGGRGVAR